MEVSHYGIKLHCLCPGFTHTNFHLRRNGGQAPKSSFLMRWMEPEEVVDSCLKSLEKGRVVHIPGFFNRLLVRIVSLIPSSLYYRLMIKITSFAARELPAPAGSVKNIHSLPRQTMANYRYI